MDDQAVGAALRQMRMRRACTQAQLAARSGVSRGLVSLLERGHLDAISLRVVRRVAAALDVLVRLRLISRGGDVDRLLNANHAALREEVAQLLASVAGWEQAHEASFAVYRERGIIDILAFHRPTSTLLVIELKTELVSFEDLLATMDIRLRLASRIASERGWRAGAVSGWVVVADSQTNRRRAARQAATLRAAFPVDGRRMRSWLLKPGDAVRALSFWSYANGDNVRQTHYTRRRVRSGQLAKKTA